MNETSIFILNKQLLEHVYSISSIVGPLLICGIAGTTLSIGIFSVLIRSPIFLYASGSLLLAAALFLFSSIITLVYIEIWDDLGLVILSGALILGGLGFVIRSLYHLVKYLKLSIEAENSGQLEI